MTQTLQDLPLAALRESALNPRRHFPEAALAELAESIRQVGILTPLLVRQAEDDVVPAAHAASLGIVPYYPLASGLLTGKYRPGSPFPAGSRFDRLPRFSTVATADNFAAVNRLSAVADTMGHSVGELAIAWLAAQPGVASVIVGATTPEQVRANAHAAEWVLDADELAAVDDAAPR